MIHVPIKIDAKIHNRFDFFLTDAKTKETKQVGYAENIILDALWTKFFNSNPNFFNSIHLGTGSGELSKARTSLFTFQVAKAAGSFVNTYDDTTGICSRRGMISFTELEQVGQIFSEIGIASSTTSSTLMTHALICDMNGNVVTIEKTATDLLTVYATVYCKFEVLTMHSGKTRIVGRTKITDNTISDWMLGSLTSLPYAGFRYYEGFGGGSTVEDRPQSRGLFSLSSSTRTIDAANKKVTYTSERLAVGDANFSGAGIGSIYSGIGILFSLVGHPLFAGTEILNESIGTGDGIITDFKTANPYIHDVTVKIDNEEVVSGLTISENEPNNNDITACMIDLYAAGESYMILPNSYRTRSGSSYSANYGGICCFENPLYATKPIVSMYIVVARNANCTLSCSDDAITWTQVGQRSSSGTFTIAEEYQYKRYWRLVHPTGGSSSFSIGLYSIMTTGYDEYKIKFATPPGLVTDESIGTGDASEITFTLPHTPITDTLVVELNGIETTDYTLDGAAITFNTAPGTGVAITASYRYSCNVTADYTTGVLAKDSNYVIDFSFALYFTEGTFA